MRAHREGFGRCFALVAAMSFMVGIRGVATGMRYEQVDGACDAGRDLDGGLPISCELEKGSKENAQGGKDSSAGAFPQHC